MKKAEFKKKMPIINGWIHSPCTLSAEILASTNFTSIASLGSAYNPVYYALDGNVRLGDGNLNI